MQLNIAKFARGLFSRVLTMAHSLMLVSAFVREINSSIYIGYQLLLSISK